MGGHDSGRESVGTTVGRVARSAGRVGYRTSCNASVGADGPVAVPKISALPYGGRLKF